MTEQTETVMSEAITVADLPWGVNPLLTAGLSIQVIRTSRAERLKARLSGLYRWPYEVCLNTAHKNSFSFVGYKTFDEAADLAERMASLGPAQLAQAFLEIDMLDAGSRSAGLLAQWHEICLAWTWGGFLPGDVVCLDEEVTVETVEGEIRVAPGKPFVITDVLLEDEREVLAMTSGGDLISLDICDLTLLALGTGPDYRKREQNYVYKKGHGYVAV